MHKSVLLLFGLLGFMALGSGAAAGPSESKLEGLLIWGTDGTAPSEANLKPVEPDVLRKLRATPFKWKRYFEVHREEFGIQEGQDSKVRMSKDCEIVVRAVDAKTIELKLYGEGKLVGQITQRLPKRELLVVGGDAENFTSWFVVLRRVE